LVGDRLQGALLVGRRAAGADGKLDREDADDPVDQAAGNETGSRQPLETAAVRALLPARSGPPNWLPLG